MAEGTAGDTIRIRGREYTVSTFGHESEDGTVETRYRLTGKRGAEYSLMRNVHRPHMLFVASWSSTLNGVWLTDKDGPLRLVES